MSRSFQDWFLENFEEEEDRTGIGEYGADAGWSGIIYTTDCVKIYEEFEDEIWENLREDSEDFGYKNPMEFVSTFNRQDMLDDLVSFKNLLVWYMCEKFSRMYVDGLIANKNPEDFEET